MFAKNEAQSRSEIETFEASSLYKIYNSETIKIYPIHHKNLLRFVFTEDFLKINKGLKLVCRSHFSYNILIIFVLKYYINCFVARLCLVLQLLSKMHFVFPAWEFDDFMALEYLNILLSQE